MEELFEGVSQSRSIKDMQFRNCSIHGAVRVSNGESSTSKERCLSLKDVTIWLGWRFFSDRICQEFISSLNETHKMQRLCLCSDIGTRGFEALRNILLDPQSILKGLKLYGVINDDYYKFPVF